MSTRMPLWVIVVVVFLLGNTAAYALYTKSSPEAPAAPVAVAPDTTAMPGPDDKGLARGLRIAGLAALEKGEYDKAAEKFQAALDAGGDGDLKELLSIATDLSNEDVGEEKAADEEAGDKGEKAVADTAGKKAPKADTKAEEKPDKAVDQKKAATESAKKADSKDKTSEAKAKPDIKAVAAKAADKPKEEPAAKAPAEKTTSVALFTTTPPGLRVVVDGKRTARTPVRMELSVGEHNVEFYYGDKRLAPGTFTVKKWGATTINRDLSDDVDALKKPKSKLKPAVASKKSEPGKPTIKEEKKPAGKGNLLIFSEVYGDVFVNGRRVGYPPVEAREIPAGSAKVEVRRGGKVERSLNVKVVPGKRTQVRVK